MATGPALRKLTSHRLIHDGAFAEARDLTEILKKLIQEERKEESLTLVDTLIEHWEKRIIAHADSEEEGLYLEIMKENPELTKEIHMLTRDHDLIRIVVQKIKDNIETEKEINEQILDQFNSLLVINEIHSRSEEELLLED